MLRGFNSKISSLGNIHFRKMFLTFIMIFTMLFSNATEVRASSNEYVYKKYNPSYSAWSESSSRSGRYNLEYSMSLYTSTPSWNGNVYTHNGYRSNSKKGYHPDLENGLLLCKYYYYEWERELFDPYDNFWFVTTYSMTRTRSKGILVEEIIAVDGTYPNGGWHTDNYYYERDRLANTAPTLTIATPSGNSYFSK